MQCIELLLIFAKRLQFRSLIKFVIFCRLRVKMPCEAIGPHRFYWMKLCVGGIGCKTLAAAATDRALRADGHERTGTRGMAHESQTLWPLWL